MMMTCSDKKELSIDIETYSSVDLKECGVYAYAEAPDFEVLLCSFKYGDEEIVQLTYEDIQNRTEAWDQFEDMLTDSDIIKTAYNAQFERACLSRVLRDAGRITSQFLDPYSWRCSAVLAVTVGLPRSLDAAGKALGLPEDQQKLKTGKALIQYFCKPCKPSKVNGGRTRNLPKHDPDKWDLFCTYNRQDVATERAILDSLRSHRPNESEQLLYTLDQRMADYGVRMDVPMCKGIVDYEEKRTASLFEEARSLTGLDNPNSLSQLKEWLVKQNFPLAQVTKETVAAALTLKYLPDDVHRVLEIREATGKTSTKKYQSVLDSVSNDGRLRGMLLFYGSRTGRWSGRIVQVHNLPQNHIEDLDLAHSFVQAGDFDGLEMLYGEPAQILSELVRTVFIPSPEHYFVVTDFSAIEARVIAWLTGEQWRLDVFRQGGDIYCASASQMYHVPVVKHGENGELRQRGKVAELALGYGGGVGAMKRMDTTGTIPEEDMQGIVDNWRAASPKIVKFWHDCENAARTCIKENRTVKLRHETGLEFSKDKQAMYIKLPSGRKIAYWDAKLEEMDDGREHITYAGIDQQTKQWTRTETYGGKITENIIQATARDCLGEKLKTVSEEGYNVVFHVHDEMIVDVPDADTGAPDKIDGIMADSIAWAPDLPLRGGTYTCRYYQKD